MMAKPKIKITIEIDPLDYIKESQEQRRDRVRKSRPMGTKIQSKKKAYKRHEKHKKDWRDYE